MKHGRILFGLLLIACSQALGQTIIFNPDLITGGTPANVAETVIVVVENTSGSSVTLSQIGGVETTFPGTDWLGVEPTSLVLPANSSDQTFMVILNKNGIFGGPGVSYRLEGYIFAKTNLADPEDSLLLPIVEYDIGGGASGSLKVDTLATPCVRLCVSESGEMGDLGSGTVNLDYLGQSIDCSPTAKVYLYSGGPMLIRKNGPTDYTFHSALYQTEGFATTQAFTVPNPGAADTLSTADYTAFTTGVLCTHDLSVGLRRTIYAPKVAASNTGPCDGMIVKTEVFSMSGSPQAHLTLAEMTDWDIPSDVNLINTGSIDATIPATYQRGVEMDGLGCQPDSNRLASQVFLAWHSSATPCVNSRTFFGSYVELTDSIIKYDTAEEAIEGQYHWNATAAAGLHATGPTQSDLFSVLTYMHDFGLSATDTLVFFTALTTVENGHLTDLQANAAELYDWYVAHLQTEFCTPCPACCVADVGNVDCDPMDGVDIGDLTALVNNLFITFVPNCCDAEANCDGDPTGNIDIGDLTGLINNLFITFTPLPGCCGQ